MKPNSPCVRIVYDRALAVASAVFAWLCICTACGPSLAPRSSDSRPDPENRGALANEHLFVEPQGDPERLLGRAVVKGEHGGWVIADDPTPGCHVRTRRVPAPVRRRYQEKLLDTGGLSTSLGTFAQLKAEYNGDVFVLLDVDNEYDLEADLSGPCAPIVVTRIKVGKGTRGFARSQREDFHAGIALQSLGTGADWMHDHGIERVFTWDKEALAWAFAVAAPLTQDGLSVRLELNRPEVVDCQKFVPTLYAAKPAHFLLLSAEADGTLSVLLPNADFRRIAHPGSGRALPLPELQAFLRNPHQEVYDRLIVYAFAEREDFESEAVQPPAGELPASEVQAYKERLDRALLGIPSRRWAQAEISYRVVPRNPARETADSPCSDER